MDTLIRSIIVATAILAAYLTATVSGLAPALQAGMATIAKSVKPLERQIEEQGVLVKRLQQELDAFRKELNDRARQEDARKNNLRILKGAISVVGGADQLRAAGKLEDAANALLSAKDAIWKSGDSFQDQQKALRGLMQPIDELAVKWRGGDAKATAAPIIEKLKTVHSSLSD
ncbi:MAG: hypothetical protein KJ558_06575 [Gammaproteobacteria bacterium]|nr:hypothetical protein [Gammaproteobacteria bacterium]MBU1654482.1 hypothetical protein [Gammaproteobacteria bacterium]MBU1960134.1 hypothetical protein [Gammaproteobacteria bacterium]